MNYQIEIRRHNVTVAEFINYVHRQTKAKGIDTYIDRESFENPPNEYHRRYHMVDGQKHSYFESPRTYTKYRPDYDSNEIIECQETVVDRWQTVEDCDDPPAVAETNKQFAYDIKTYVLNHDGSCYSQIVEFTFDDEKTGHGYFYEFNRD